MRMRDAQDVLEAGEGTRGAAATWSPAGRWRVVRRIARRGLAAARFAGDLNVTASDEDAHTLRAVETGRLSGPEGAFAAEQRRLWRRIDPADTEPFALAVWSLCYPDGAPLVTLRLLPGGQAQATHLCGDDFYEARLTVLSADRWRLGWRVMGPKKDYVSATLHVRQHAPSPR